MNRQRVFVTGLGIVTSLGLGVDKNWRSALAGQSGIKLIDADYPDSPVSVAGKIDESDLLTIRTEFPEEASKEAEPRTIFALWAAKEALQDAGLLNSANTNVGVSFATGLAINRLEDLADFLDGRSFDYDRFYKNYHRVHEQSIMKNNSHRPSTLIANRFGLRAKNVTVSSACASATQAIGVGLRTVQYGEAEAMLCGGADSMINPIGLVFFVLLGAAATAKDINACRPFDRRRSGLVMGEGAAFVVLESERSAIKRDAKIYCECVGYGSSMDAYQVTAPEPEGSGAYICMQRALRDGGLEVTEVDYINAHGTSTKLNDLAETKAIKRLFGEHAYKIKINSTKSIIGHLLAASGAPEAVFTVLSIRDGVVHPTLNLSVTDRDCDLDYTANKSSSCNIRSALSNSFGFGGQNATVVFKKYEP